jgi:uncharacterized protein YidB (DUF937 family)
MGLLDSLIPGGNQQGGMSKLNMLLLGILAYRTYQGKGRLADMLRTNGINLPGTQSAPNLNPAGTPNVPPGAGPMGMPGNTASGGLSDMLRNTLGGLLGGAAAGGVVSGGLSDLLRQFTNNGNPTAPSSWIGNGPNRAISPDEVENGLGADSIRSLSEHSGLPREQVLSELSQGLPDVVNQLTPEGRIPADHEHKWI